MKMHSFVARVMGLLMVAAAVTTMTACAGKHVKGTVGTPIQDLKAPEWVKKGSGAFHAEKGDGKYFYGVSSAVGIQNTALLRTTAENRARSEVAKVFQVYTASLMKDYAASTMAGDPNVTTEEQHVEQAIKTVTAMTLSGVEVVDYWQNPDSGELYTLARLDLVAFKENLDRARELDAGVRDFIRKNAERLHGELEQEEERLLAR